MPNNYNFTKLRNIREMEVNPKGWISPLYVEYGDGIYGGIPSYYWRVKGTKHTFIIPVLRMDYLSKGEYEKHFEDVLETFREDYKGWKEEGFYSDWMKQYNNDFRNFISL